MTRLNLQTGCVSLLASLIYERWRGELEVSNIETISSDDLDAITNSMVAAFVSDPTARYIYPKLADYFPSFKVFSRVYFERATKLATAWKIEGSTAAIACFPPGEKPNDQAIIDQIKLTCPSDTLEELMKAGARLENNHPKEPHWTIAMVGVDPFHRGLGLGRQLLHHAFKLIEKEGMPIYFESSNPQNVIRYELLGFQSLDKLSLGGKPVITPMLRPAH